MFFPQVFLCYCCSAILIYFQKSSTRTKTKTNFHEIVVRNKLYGEPYVFIDSFPLTHLSQRESLVLHITRSVLQDHKTVCLCFTFCRSFICTDKVSSIMQSLLGKSGVLCGYFHVIFCVISLIIFLCFVIIFPRRGVFVFNFSTISIQKQIKRHFCNFIC